ncbi:LysR substrate-binding domain-containing protein [Streptomyces sp. NPDC088745]|uniref:LysR substrate-binding domain-containing protein n=1 Tax=Streptomyces sp. NPDC088745 TaxID=3365884 RepID=UPI00381E5BF1
MDLEIRHLRAVTAIADAGSLHKAARVLGVAQPTLTAQLRRIEESLGGTLFLRLPEGCRPTFLGHQLLARARPVLAEMNQLTDQMRAAARAERNSHLRIGSTPTHAVAPWLRLLSERFPEARPTVHAEASSCALLRMVAAGQLDAALVHEPEGCPLRIPADVRLRVLLEREPQLLGVFEHHPAARQKTVRLQDLADERWMIDKTADGEWEQLDRVLRAAGVTPQILHGDFATISMLVSTGQAVMVCNGTSTGRNGAVVRRLEGDPIAARWLLAARSDVCLDAVYDDLVTAYREVADQAPLYKTIGPPVFGPTP